MAAPNPTALFSHVLSPDSGPTEHVLHMKKSAQGPGGPGDKAFSVFGDQQARGSVMSRSINTQKQRALILMPTVAQRARRAKQMIRMSSSVWHHVCREHTQSDQHRFWLPVMSCYASAACFAHFLIISIRADEASFIIVTKQCYILNLQRTFCSRRPSRLLQNVNHQHVSGSCDLTNRKCSTTAENQRRRANAD